MMREEHPDQQELPELPPGGPVPAPPADNVQVREMSEVAAVQGKVLDLGLVRESRPVFVYDAKLARQKTGNAARQARLREKRAAQGLVMAQIPAEIADRLKAAGGDWSTILRQGDPATPAPLGAPVAPQTPLASGWEGIPPTTRSEILEAGGIEPWVQKKIDFAVAALPPAPVPAPKIIEKIVEKQVLKLTSEQKKALELGQKVRALRGFRAKLARWIL